MKDYKFSLKDLWTHHTENDAVRITLIKGKDHTHLEIQEGQIGRQFISRSKAELIDYAIDLLKAYKRQLKRRGRFKW